MVLLLGMVVATGSVAAAGNEDGRKPRLRHYRVTIVNLATGQPISPPVVATHRAYVSMFHAGGLASPEIEALAEDGNQSLLVAALTGAHGVTDVVDVGMPLTRHGTTVGDFADSVTIEIAARPGDRLSLAGMLICTNDGFAGLDGVWLPRHGTAVYRARGYDAGTEENTERSADIVDPCSALGPVPLPGDPDGNENVAVNTYPAQYIMRHPGIMGNGDLSAVHDWDGAVLKVFVTRID
ncbi:MAG: hypothetical protein D6706_07230 [Chloroflexi bacterium]|nr:MAG: hypothetical protein D6706_07230 [Chloroflexota bacterium]